MKLTAPVYRLKRQAKALSRQEGIPLHLALDRVAIGEGFGARVCSRPNRPIRFRPMSCSPAWCPETCC